MTGTPKDVTAAQHEVAAARAQLLATANELHDRLRPSFLARRGVDRLKVRSTEIAHDTIDAAEANPQLVGTVSAGAMLFLLRRPIFRLARRVFSRRNDTAGTDDG